MKQAIIVLSLVAATTTVVMSEPILGGLVALGLLKIGAFKLGAAIGSAASRRRGFRGSRRSRRRFGRSIEDDKVQDILLRASVEDVDDCAKNFVCQLNTKSIKSMDAFERTIFAVYGQDPTIDVSRSDVEFQLASNIGRLSGIQHCKTIYARCPMEYGQLLKTIEGTFTQNEPLNLL